MQLPPDDGNERRTLLARKDELAIQMHSIDAKLTSIKNDIRRKGLMSHTDYDRHLKNQAKLVQAKIEIEKELAQIKHRLVEIADAQHVNEQERKSKELEVFASPEIVRQLVALRQTYQEFAADLTRVASMRTMAAQFVLSLSAIIKDDLKRPLPPKNNETLDLKDK